MYDPYDHKLADDLQARVIGLARTTGVAVS